MSLTFSLTLCIRLLRGPEPSAGVMCGDIIRINSGFVHSSNTPLESMEKLDQ